MKEGENHWKGQRGEKFKNKIKGDEKTELLEYLILRLERMIYPVNQQAPCHADLSSVCS
jgi:hypothetical protein